jgi:hypothetical protein
MRTSLVVVAGILMLGLVGMRAWGQEPASTDLNAQINGYERAAHSAFVGVPTDWSTSHVVFSAPEPGSDAEYQVQQDPRYWLQQIRRAQLQAGDSIAGDSEAVALPDKKKKKKPKKIKKLPIKKDWSESLGAAGSKVGAGFFPAKFTFGTSAASCSDYVVYNTALAGSGGQASIIAFTNLYTTGCTAPVPKTAWAYNTGGTVSTSVVLSSDGKQMAFIHSAAGGASLEVLRPVTGQGTSATAPVSPGTTSTTGSAYVTCKSGGGSCLLSLAFGNSANDTNSSPFYVYGGTNADTIFVGDDTGFVHKFTGVFNGAPAEVTMGGFPAQAAVVKVSGPVYDDASKTLFVVSSFDGNTPSNGGRIHEVSASTGITPSEGNSNILGPWTSGEGGCNTPGTSGTGTPLTADAPIVDPAAGTNGMVYVFMGNNGADNAAVYQFAPGFGETTCGNMVTVGTGSTGGVPLYSGSFDALYFAAATTGNIYVCGTTGGDAQLWRIPITVSSNALGTPVAITTTLSTATTTCSQVTEFKNGTVDQAYVSVEGTGRPTACAVAGCVMSFTITTALAAGATPSAALEEPGGTSGIVVDNSSALAGASQIYFSTLAAPPAGGGGLAIQAAQSGL